MILAGDIGGTNSRLAFFASHGGQLERVAEETYATADFASLEAIIQMFVSSHDLSVDVVSKHDSNCIRTFYALSRLPARGSVRS